MTQRKSFNLRRALAATLAAAATVAVPFSANADLVYREGPGPRRYYDETFYPIEIEPHFSFGAADVYGPAGFGAGLRLGVPFVRGHVGYAPENLAITFGADILHYDNCYFSGDCGANYLMLPVALQWNVFVARRVSLFAEGGAFLYNGWVDDCAVAGCAGAPSTLGVLPTVAIGGRVHIGPVAALTLRIGYPISTFGVSFL
jgi:hypothetical protein